MSEREQFEAWAMRFNPQLLINFGRGPTVHGQIAWEAWQAARAQPAQAGHVPEASCGECGKKASVGWALYCVACMEKAGLPAQAMPLLSEDEIKAEIYSRGQMVNGVKGDGFMQGARWGEQAVRAKLGVAVPMTDEQIDAMATACKYTFHATMIDHRALARAVERHHGIVGKEGA